MERCPCPPHAERLTRPSSMSTKSRTAIEMRARLTRSIRDAERVQGLLQITVAVETSRRDQLDGLASQVSIFRGRDLGEIL
jgi:hypothetical protein